MQNLKELIENNIIVVVDLETTGLNNSGEEIDHIIQVSAVKIIKGKTPERFYSFVACPIKLPVEVSNLTGITDERLAQAQPIGEVLKKFYKFAEGCILIAHNMPFYYAFLKYYSEKERLQFDNQCFDLVDFAKEVLGEQVKNYRLVTLAHFFDIEPILRVLGEAEATAKILLELANFYW